MRTNNPELAGSGDIKASERADAGTLDFEDVVTALERVCLAVEGEGEVGEVGNLVAVKRVLAVPGLGGADSASN